MTSSLVIRTPPDRFIARAYPQADENCSCTELPPLSEGRMREKRRSVQAPYGKSVADLRDKLRFHAGRERPFWRLLEDAIAALRSAGCGTRFMDLAIAGGTADMQHMAPLALVDHYLGISRQLAGQLDFRSAIRAVAVR